MVKRKICKNCGFVDPKPDEQNSTFVPLSAVIEMQHMLAEAYYFIYQHCGNTGILDQSDSRATKLLNQIEEFLEKQVPKKK